MTVEMEKRPHLQDDHMSGNWSFGSNYHLCSQSRKISIGVVVDSSAKMKGKNVKGVVAELQTSENRTSAKDVTAENEQKGKEVMSPHIGRQNKAPIQETSPWVCTKTSYQNVSYSDIVGQLKKVPSLPSPSNVLLQYSGRKIVGETQRVPFFVNQASNLHAGDANEKKLKENTYQRKRGNHGIMGREEESSHATVQKVLPPEKGTTEQGTSERGNNENVTLRMKVQELLGTVHSPNQKQCNSETFELDANNLKQKSETNRVDSFVSSHRQYLDTIETNSGSLDHKTRRVVTRSLTRKKPLAQKSLPKKQARFDENEFSFAEAWSGRLNSDVNHASTTCKRKEREISGTGPVKKCVREGDHKDETQQATVGRKTKAAAKNVSSLENRTGSCEMVKPNNEMKEKAPHQYEVIKTRYQPGSNNGPTLYNNVDQDPFAKHSLTKNVDPQCDLKSPTFELKTATRISSSRSLFQINQEDLDVDSPAERIFKTKGTHSFNSTGFSKGGHYKTNTKCVATDLRDSPVVKPVSLSKENRCSRSPSKEVQSESSDDGSPVTVPIISENREGNRWSISPCEEVDSESSEDGTPIKGGGDDDSSEQDGLVGAVKLFALALERVQSKIRSTTSRQSAEILLSVSKNIHLQLQNAESNIQNDVAKLTSLGNCKRMRPENQCQEQQEQLKRIYEKFKDEVDQHLEKCRSTLEGLEAHQIEVRGLVEKQRLSHRKLLLQTEEAIETQLNDAQRRLADVHRLAREKMLKLKYGISECLKQGLLG